LTHEVENSGDGTASQQSEVQTVTFNAGRGLGGTATLTYHDLYGQSWTTRPFNVGGDNVYRLEVSVAPGTAILASNHKHKLIFKYNGVASAADNSGLAIHGDADYAVGTSTLTAEKIREVLLPIFGAYQAKPYVGKDRGNTIHVNKRHSATSVKLGGTIHANSRLTFDIHVPIDMSGHDDNGELSSAFTVEWDGAHLTADDNAAELKLYQLGDRSAEIESALTSLPNQVIPGVTVSKVGYTDADTNSDGTNGNAYGQSYAITFNNEANAGDQNMLTCNAGPCDESGCINRGPGVAEVRYMHHDAETRGEGINFVNQGYFIMDIGSNTAHADLSAGTIRIMWDTGAGVSSAEFAVVATAAEVQTALRTISGWEGVTVELWGSIKSGATAVAAKLLLNHQFKVTFAAGYDDLGKSPTFKTLGPSDGTYATATNSPVAKLYDQRFSNSIWLGKITGYVILENAGTTDGLTKHFAIDSAVDITASTNTGGSINTLPVNGDTWVTSNTFFGAGGGAADIATPGASSGGSIVIHNDAAEGSKIAAGNLGGIAAGKNFAYLKESAISVQTSDYFAVGSSIEVMGTTWDDDAIGTDVDVGVLSNNKYRKFKVTGHVTNPFNREFAKLDSFPADDGITPLTANSAKPDYNLKITSNNATVHTYPSLAAQVTVNEIQVVVFGTGADDQTGTFKLYYGTEETADMDEASSQTQIAEEINSFSHLSGPVTVAAEGNNWVVTFDAKDGDVAEMTAQSTSGGVSIATRANGWSIEAPVGLGLDTIQAGGIINITAAEVCTFTEGTAGTVGYYCYDGVCGPASADGTGAKHLLALQAIKDDNGDAILGSAAIAETGATVVKTVTMPMGKSCDGLELRGTTNAITKTVNKHNNGKTFKITRSFLQSSLMGTGVTGVTFTSATVIVCAAGAQTATTGCHGVLDDVDSVVIQDVASCLAKVAATDGAAYPMSRTITTVATSSGAHTLTIGEIGIDGDNTNAGVKHSTKCNFMLARHVITLDSMPTASATTTDKSLEYTSPVGSCGVSETTKGTYESYECSNRGACDGKSGLCACYEGYSGQSCQTQTVLV